MVFYGNSLQFNVLIYSIIIGLVLFRVPRGTLNYYRPKNTNNTETSEGDTPEIREA